MKVALIIFLSFLTLNAFTSECQKFKDMTINGFYTAYSDEPKEEFSFEKTFDAFLNLSEEQFMAIDYIGSHFSYEKCKGAIKKIEFFDLKTLEKYEAFYTYEDYCDGAKSYGVVYNSTGEIVSRIFENQFECISPLK